VERDGPVQFEKDRVITTEGKDSEEDKLRLDEFFHEVRQKSDSKKTTSKESNVGTTKLGIMHAVGGGSAGIDELRNNKTRKIAFEKSETGKIDDDVENSSEKISKNEDAAGPVYRPHRESQNRDRDRDYRDRDRERDRDYRDRDRDRDYREQHRHRDRDYRDRDSFRDRERERKPREDNPEKYLERADKNRDRNRDREERDSPRDDKRRKK